MLVNCNAPEIPQILLQGESISLSEAKSKRHQFLVTQYPADLEDSPVVDLEEVASIDVFPGVLDGRPIGARKI